MVKIKLCSREVEIAGILSLQEANLGKNISLQEAREQGYVTVEHDFLLLKRMNEKAPSIIAISQDEVVGYTLAMTKDFRFQIPVLVPMFEMIDTLSFKGFSLKVEEYIVAGQVCVAKGFRGQRLLDRLYQFFQEQYAARFSFIVTEIASDNLRSLRAHRRVGFEPIHQYFSPDGMSWDIVIWDWKAKC
jgi:GNAT superfamily N-acetyltransferase